MFSLDMLFRSVASEDGAALAAVIVGIATQLPAVLTAVVAPEPVTVIAAAL